MRYVEAVEEWEYASPSIFLAGGITNCPDWQADARAYFEAHGPKDLTVLNPRRVNFPMDDPSAAEEQISWEFRHLDRADVVMFWFPAGESVQPISLYELGRHATLGVSELRKIAVGASGSYLRRQDVRVQMTLARPDVPVWLTLDATCRHALSLFGDAGNAADV